MDYISCFCRRLASAQHSGSIANGRQGDRVGIVTKHTKLTVLRGFSKKSLKPYIVIQNFHHVFKIQFLCHCDVESQASSEDITRLEF